MRATACGWTRRRSRRHESTPRAGMLSTWRNGFVNYKLQVTRAVSKLISTAGLTCRELVRLLAWLHDDLPGRADECRHIRASDADGCFTYEVNLEAEDG